MSDIQARHRKQLQAMRRFLTRRKFFRALDALDLVCEVESGTRKDQRTPKAHHQLSVARLVASLLPHLRHREESLVTAFLHDLLEDHGQDWTIEMVRNRFGQLVADAVWAITKKYRGVLKPLADYYAGVAANAIASVVKLADRAHNIQTMHGVFTLEKQLAYVRDLDDWYFPMLRTARRRFRSQYEAYENLKMFLHSQRAMVHRILEASGVEIGGAPA